MTWLTRIFRHTLYNDLAEEIRLHLEEKTEQFIREGMSHEDAGQAARRAFGNATLIEERSREVWQWPRIESIWADAKYALRQLRKSPGISAVAILTLAFGIGANTAIFTLTWNVVLKSLPVPRPGQLVEYEMRSGDNMMGVSGPEFTLLSQRQKSCIGLLAWSSDQPSVRQGTQTAPQWVQLLTGNAFQVLQMQPYLGRAFSQEEDGLSKTNGVPALLSYDYWQRQFLGNENALGQTLYVESHPVTVVGVMPRAFDGLTANLHPAIYLPMSFANILFGRDYLTSPGHFGQFVLGRFKPGMTLAAAAAEVRALEPSLRKDADPGGMYLAQFFKDFRLSVRSGRSGVSWVKMTYERSLLVLELLVLFLLILCAVNTALVLMARVSGRRQEYALRATLGASRFSVVRQVLAEAFLLALPGLAAGILLGWLGSHALVAMLGERGATSAMDLRPNRWILAFNLASTLAIALGSGLVPALRAAQTAPALDLKAGDRSVASARLGGWAISMQVAVSVCLVSAALLFGNTLAGLLAANGLVFKGAVAANVGLAPLKLTDAQNAGFFARLADALQSRPGVEAVGFTDLRPLSGGPLSTSRMFALDSRGNVHSSPGLAWIQATPGLFPAMGIRVLAGRLLASASSALQNCVLGESASKIFFPQENAIGRSIFFSTAGKTDGAVLNPAASCRVVAVVQDARYLSLRKPAPQTVYGLLQANAWNSSFANVVVRAGSDPLALEAVRATVTNVLPDGLVIQPRTFTELADQDLSRERTLVSLAGTFALLALLLTALGLYGLLMRAITLRTREIGVRIALGAQRKSILLTIGRDAFVEVVAGLLTGTFVAVLLSHTVRRLLGLQAHSGVTGLDVASYLLAAILFFLVLLAAVLPPALRAAGPDPMKALRSA